MNYTSRIKKTALLIAAALLMACSYSDSELSFSDWDINKDSLVSEEEFEKTFTANYHRDLNRDDDPYLDDEDFISSVFYTWDENRNERLEEEEWIMGYDYFQGNYLIYDFVNVDSSNDGSVDYTEYEKILSPTNFYVKWDANNNDIIEGQELASGLFMIWDLDNSDYIELDEYEQFDSFYADF